MTFSDFLRAFMISLMRRPRSLTATVSLLIRTLQFGGSEPAPNSGAVALQSSALIESMMFFTSDGGVSGRPVVSFGTSMSYPRWASGVITMKMISSTSTTSTRGVMLMSDLVPP